MLSVFAEGVMRGAVIGRGGESLKVQGTKGVTSVKDKGRG